MSVQKHEIEIIFLTLCKIMPASGKSNKEGYLTSPNGLLVFLPAHISVAHGLSEGIKVRALGCHDLSF